MRAAFDPVQRVHEPDAMVVLGVSRPHPERVEGVDRLLEGLGRPGVHPHGRDAARPDSVVGRAGRHMFDLASPIGPQTYRAACASANTAVTAADMVLFGDHRAYALCRPPGHHMTADGFSRIEAAIVAMGLPTVYVQEGGYASDALADDLVAVLSEAAAA